MSFVGGDGAIATPGLGRVLRQLRDPLLLFVVPITFAVLLAFVGYSASWPIGFDFRGTLWEPARALLDGVPIYPEPTREAVVVGNPAVYPPVFVLAAVRWRSCRSVLPRGAGSSSFAAVSSLRIGPRCPRLALSRARGHLAGGRAPSFLRKPDAGIGAAGCGRLALPGSRPRRRHRRGGRGGGEAVRLAARRLAAPDATLPGRGLGRGVGCGADARGVGADRLRGVPGLSELLRAVQDVYADAASCCRPSRARSAPRCRPPSPCPRPPVSLCLGVAAWLSGRPTATGAPSPSW